MRRIGRVSGYAGGFVLLSLCYVVLRWGLQLAAPRVRSNDFKELEIVVLRHVSMRDPLVDLTRKSIGETGAQVLAKDRMD